jgi:PAS domain S-box-containing protein
MQLSPVNSTKPSFPWKFLLLVCLLTLLVQGWTIYLSISVVRFAGDVLDYDMQIEEIRDRIIHYDEVLTMSARMAAFTGDLKWQARYDDHVILLEQDLARANELAPSASSKLGNQQVIEANDRLVAMEQEAFRLLHSGQLEAARRLLMSEDYEVYKRDYQHGMQQFSSALHENAREGALTQQRLAFISLALIAVLVLVNVISWWLMLRMIFRWQRQLQLLNDRLQQSEQIARGQSNLLESILENLPLGLLVKNVSDGMRIERCNLGFEKAFGLRREDILGKTDAAVFSAADAQKASASDAAALAKRSAIHQEELLETPQGQRLQSVTRAPVLDDFGEPRLLLVITRDITETHEAWREAERANQLQAAFLANISHELRTPLNAILGFSRQGMQHLARWSVEESRENLACIQDAGKRLLNLLNDLLDLSRLEAGAFDLDLQERDLHTLCQSAGREVGSLLTEKALQVSCGIPPQLRLSCDSRKLHQVLVNLLSNAIRFSPPGGTIFISGERSGALVRLWVEDQGPGIPEADLTAIFDKFVQSRDGRVMSGGTGLGLAICREIVQAHHGQIRALNRVEGGACLLIELPDTEMQASNEESA